jgi:hypothetical protein
MKWRHTLLTNGYMSGIVSNNSTQTLRFEWWFTFLKSYESQTWLQPYVCHNIRKYELMLPFVMKKYLLFILFQYKKKKLYKKINEIAINMKTNSIGWNIVILQKDRKNQWISSYYERETLVSDFNCRLKRKSDGGNELMVRHVVPAKQLD